MNWSRGLIRTWIASSAIWLLIVAALIRPWEAAETVLFSEDPQPFASGETAKVRPAAVDRLTGDSANHQHRWWEADPIVESATPSGMRVFEVEGADGKVARVKATDEKNAIQAYVQLRQDLATAVANARTRRAWNDLSVFAVFAFAPVFAVLIIGLIAAWVVRGFRRAPQ
ncbi:MAG: hypothetical protein CL627_14675 [Aurantimonas sp.]|nr:hypothetical protein [Aurantimonas sp.]